MQRSMIALAGAAGVAFFILAPTVSLAASEATPAPGGADAQQVADAPPKPAEAAPAPAPHASAPAPDAPRPQQASDSPESKPSRPASARRSARDARPAQPETICKPAAVAHKPRHLAAPVAPPYSRAPGAIQLARGFPIILGISY